MLSPSPNAVLLLSCPDQRGIVRSVAEFVEHHGGNIVDAEQHTDGAEGVFFQRVEFELTGFGLDRGEILDAFEPVRARFEMAADLRFTDDRVKLAVLASKQPHCLDDLLTRWRTGELDAALTMVIANHPEHAALCEFVGVPFHYLPVSADNKPAQERRVRELLREQNVQLVVLARYMQILSAEFT
ncbi:MAG: purU, partial [Acidimicrobiia bacterium]|nr:purU [Acidimicrobiia bacterium]